MKEKMLDLKNVEAVHTHTHTHTHTLGSARERKAKTDKVSGITLVALVVTIVVLLILAGITLTYVLGDNGIFKLAQDARTKMNQASENEQKYLSDIANKIQNVVEGNENSDTDGWTLETSLSSPYYPDNYPNNCRISEKKVYDENVKAIKIVILDCQLEGGSSYDYILLKDQNGLTLKIGDGDIGEIILEGNSFEYYFTTDGSVTRRGFKLEVYTTTQESLATTQINNGTSVRYALTSLNAQTEQQKIHIQPGKSVEILMEYAVYKKDTTTDSWSIVYRPVEGDLALNTLVTIANTEGEVLYSQEIKDGVEKLTPEITNCPENIIVSIKRRKFRTMFDDVRCTNKI